MQQPAADESRKETRAAIGPDKLQEYDQVHDKIKKRLTELGGQRPTQEEMERSGKTRRQLVSEAKQAVARLGIDTGGIAHLVVLVSRLRPRPRRCRSWLSRDSAP
jgi:activator of 2-hydroxyglutaryl-CoA dehydratase